MLLLALALLLPCPAAALLPVAWVELSLGAVAGPDSAVSPAGDDKEEGNQQLGARGFGVLTHPWYAGPALPASAASSCWMSGRGMPCCCRMHMACCKLNRNACGLQQGSSLLGFVLAALTSRVRAEDVEKPLCLRFCACSTRSAAHHAACSTRLAAVCAAQAAIRCSHNSSTASLGAPI